MFFAFLIRHKALCPIHFTFFVKWVGNHGASFSGSHRRRLLQQLPGNSRRGLQRRVNLRLVLAAGFGDLGFPAA